MDALWQDVRYAIRMLAKGGSFTAAAVLALALGIGANTAVFSLVNSLLLHPTPYKEADRIAILWETRKDLGWNRVGPSGPAYIDWRDRSRSFQSLALLENGTGTLTGMGEPEQFAGMRVSTNFLSALNIKVMMGRDFGPGEGFEQRVGIVTYGWWQRRFGGDPNIIGRQVVVDGLPYTLIGVLPPDFWTPLPCEALVPFSDADLRKQPRTSRDYGVVGRLKHGVTMEQAQAEMSAIAAQIGREHQEAKGWDVVVAPFEQVMTESLRPILLAVLGAVAFVLLIACTNVANLLLARAAIRSREVAIRLALGAGRGTLIRQFLTESALLSLLGGTLGFLFALWGVDMLVRLLPGSVPIPDGAAEVLVGRVNIDYRVALFTLGISLATGLLFGLAPALTASSGAVISTIKDGTRSAGSPVHSRLRTGLVGLQVTFAVVLLIGAGLMMNSVLRLTHASLGVDPEGVLTARVELPTDSKYKQPAQQSRFYTQALAEIAAMPGVDSAGAATLIPLQQDVQRTVFRRELPQVGLEQQVMPVDFRGVSPDYFRTMRIALKRGRAFDRSDHEEAPLVAIIDERAAARYFPNEDPIGQRILLRQPRVIVGIVGEVRGAGMDKQPQPTLYVPLAQSPRNEVTFVVRTSRDPISLANTVKSAIWRVDRDQPIFEVRTMREIVENAGAGSRLALILLSIFAGAALVLAAVGIYGVVSYTVNQRTQEIGVRMALGAGVRETLLLILRGSLAIALAGIGAGFILAIQLRRVIARILFDTSPTDPATFAAVGGVLLLVALFAAWIPARRASRIDPLAALRYE